MIKRNVFNAILSLLDKEDILLLVGARQVGKTSLLKVIAEHLETVGRRFYSFTLEDPSLLFDLNNHPEEIFRYIDRNTQPFYLLIDEIQYLDDPSNFLKYLYDQYKGGINLVVTGSSAFYIDRKFKDSLAGRKRIIEVFPFSFTEFLTARNEQGLADQLKNDPFKLPIAKRKFPVRIRRRMFEYWNEYRHFGGYPKIVLEDDREEKCIHLRDLYTSFLKKDVLEAGVRHIDKFYGLLKIIASQSGQLVNMNELANTLNISVNAIQNYFYVLQKSYIVKQCPPFSGNIRKELTKMSKFYFFDNGFRNAVLNISPQPIDSSDQGIMLEAMVMSELTKAGVSDIKFWRTQDKIEIDFIIEEKYALEVKQNPRAFRKNRYKNFLAHYPTVDLDIITYNDDVLIDVLDIAN